MRLGLRFTLRVAAVALLLGAACDIALVAMLPLGLLRFAVGVLAGVELALAFAVWLAVRRIQPVSPPPLLREDAKDWKRS